MFSPCLAALFITATYILGVFCSPAPNEFVFVIPPSPIEAGHTAQFGFDNHDNSKWKDKVFRGFSHATQFIFDLPNGTLLEDNTVTPAGFLNGTFVFPLPVNITGT